MFRVVCLGVFALVFMLGSGGTVYGAEPVGVKGSMGDEKVLVRDRMRAKSLHPGLDVDLLMRFYAEYSPDLLAEWRRRSVARPSESGAYFERLVSHFLELEAIRLSDLAEYNRLVEYEVMQGKVRELSREIRRLVKLGEELLSQETEAFRLECLNKAKADLAVLLGRAFDESIRQQRHEIDKLEFEIQELRRLAEERLRGREKTIADKFRKLTGQELPKN